MSDRKLFSDASRVTIKNDTGETIPARSFVRITGGSTLTGKQQCFTVAKPNGTSGVFVVTGLSAIANGSVGYGYWPNTPVWVEFNSDDGTPSPVEEVGPEESGWEATVFGSGFNCLRVSGSLALIVSAASSGAGGGGGGLANCECTAIETGTVSCLGTNDSPEVYVVTGLSAWLTSLGFTGVPDEIELTFDSSCTWISDDLSRSCGYGS